MNGQTESDLSEPVSPIIVDSSSIREESLINQAIEKSKNDTKMDVELEKALKESVL